MASHARNSDRAASSQIAKAKMPLSSDSIASPLASKGEEDFGIGLAAK